MVRVLEGLLGPGFNYAGGDSALYTGDTNWHVDNDHCVMHGGMFSLKLAIYVDEMLPGEGCLRVIPGSHLAAHPLRRAVAALQLAVERDSAQAAGLAAAHPVAVDIPTRPGDAVAFNHDIYHGSFGGGPRRRMFTMNCTRKARTAADWTTLARYVREHTPGAYDVHTGGGMYHPLMLSTAGVRRWRYLEQLHALHDELYPALRGGLAPSFSPSQPKWDAAAMARPTPRL